MLRHVLPSGILRIPACSPACVGGRHVLRHVLVSGILRIPACSPACVPFPACSPACVGGRHVLRHPSDSGRCSGIFLLVKHAGILRIPADPPACVGFRHPPDAPASFGFRQILRHVLPSGILWGGRGGDVADRYILWYADSMPSEELSAKLAAVEAKLDLLIVSMGAQAANVSELRDRIGDLERHRSFLLGAFAAGSAVGGLIMTLFDKL